MAIRGDSFGDADEVAAYCRWLLGGAPAFDTSTKPTLAQVESMMDNVSGQINIAIRACGFTPSDVYANSTAKLAIDGWVNAAIAERVELTYPGTGFNDGQNTRTAGFRNLYKQANEFIEDICKGLKHSGIAVNKASSNGLAFTALNKRSERSDPTDTSREQPMFRRRLFDNPEYTSVDDPDDNT